MASTFVQFDGHCDFELDPQLISIDQKEKKIFFEASDIQLGEFRRLTSGFPRHIANFGLCAKSLKLNEVIAFRLEHRAERNGDLLYWELVPLGLVKRNQYGYRAEPCDEFAGWKMIIFND